MLGLSKVAPCFKGSKNLTLELLVKLLPNTASSSSCVYSVALGVGSTYVKSSTVISF